MIAILLFKNASFFVFATSARPAPVALVHPDRLATPVRPAPVALVHPDRLTTPARPAPVALVHPVRHLVNCSVLAAIFALILTFLNSNIINQTYSEVP